MQCEVCGSRYSRRRAKIEGVILRVCSNCVKLGEELPVVEIKKVKKKIQKIEEKIIKPNFSFIIKEKREKMKLTQEQLANKLNEKLSIIRKIENGWEPSSKLIEKLEKLFKIKLFEVPKEEYIEKQERKNLTIGDIVEIK